MHLAIFYGTLMTYVIPSNRNSATKIVNTTMAQCYVKNLMYIYFVVSLISCASITAGLSLEDLQFEMQQQMKQINEELTLQIRQIKQSNVSRPIILHTCLLEAELCLLQKYWWNYKNNVSCFIQNSINNTLIYKQISTFRIGRSIVFLQLWRFSE